jgi:GrpB-like predicted nucleotidyltransferase (UPF0157 family)/N-acetylglutamate synthase-like GNAT family acetyltransferase
MMKDKMFCDIKNNIDAPTVCEILAACVFDNSPEGMAHEIAKYQANPDMQFYGYHENGELLGVCGFEEHENRMEILHIAARETARHKGVGSAMVMALRRKYCKAIEAETDDDAVDFYRKCGFETTAIQKYNVRRWVCVLPAPEITVENRAALFPIILTDYNPEWSIWYADEKPKIERAVGAENIARLRHYGSTSIPWMFAKPTVDILLEIPENADVTGIKERMKSAGYICLDGDSLTMDTPPPHMTFIEGYTPFGFAERVFHIHVQYIGDREPDEILFRDYLITHPDAAAEYADLKRSLWKNFEHDRDGYTAAKGEFVRRVTEKAKGERK